MKVHLGRKIDLRKITFGRRSAKENLRKIFCEKNLRKTNLRKMIFGRFPRKKDLRKMQTFRRFLHLRKTDLRKNFKNFLPFFLHLRKMQSKKKEDFRNLRKEESAEGANFRRSSDFSICDCNSALDL